MKLITLASAFATLLASSSVLAATGFCAQYEHKPHYLVAIEKVAEETKYTTEELCNLGRLGDIYVADRIVYNEKMEPIPHIGVTLVYNEYACDYFVRKSDQVITRQKCHNQF